ncbi:L-serine dehydratase 1 [Budvicia aquatica]|nr:L-serine dehydratase 1 [Budvicia aquatica]
MRVNETQKLPLAQSVHEVDFLRNGGMIFHLDNLPLHENGLRIHAYANDREVYSQTYYSIGGGFIVDEAHFGQESADSQTVPYPFKSAAELMEQCQRSGMSLSGLVLQNELAWHTKAEIEQYFMQIWRTMTDCMQKGLNTEGILPGPLRVTRRAPSLQRILTSSDTLSVDPMGVIDWVNLFALAVSEENAAGGRVVTAPTNGACGIIPAVLAYYGRFIQPLTSVLIIRYFMASGVIGILYKANASISGAEVGCQGEVGVACSMAASGLAELMGGNPAQVCSAAEIGMEHNLGLTCDPVAGQVQVPCIERNAIAAVQAINAARMALQRTTAPYVSLDNVIETMYETGKDLNPKYRETSRGGLAIKITMCE